MQYIHRQNIAHRDLKLENILLTVDDPPIVKVADFGLAKVVGAYSNLHVRPILLSCSLDAEATHRAGVALAITSRQRFWKATVCNRIPKSSTAGVWASSLLSCV